MTDLQATLDAIDEVAVHQCGHCAKPLSADGESPDYCGPECQAAWLAAKHEVDELVGYREPVDLPQYQGNLVELRSPETSSPTGDMRGNLGHQPGGYATPADLTALLAQVRPFARERLNHWVDARRERDDAAVERVQAGQWLARFAAPWHPRPMTVRSEYQGRPPEMLHAVRPAPGPIWTMEDPVAESIEFRPDVYRLESINEHDRSATYRIQGLPGPRRAVFRWADGQPPTWWMQEAWEGRWIEVEDGARGHRWGYPSGHAVTAVPTERYETGDGGAVAEVWEAVPGHGSRDPMEAAYRAEMYQWRIMQETRRRALEMSDPGSAIRITGV